MMTARTLTLALATAAATAASLGACSPYDPDLGDTPYLCAAQEPRCPDDYQCVEEPGARPLCVRPGASLPDAAIDGPSGFQCAVDGMLEPNDSTSQAFQTDVGTGAQLRVFGPVSICPELDRDYYQINITTANHGIEVITRWDSGSAVSNSILNRSGNAIANGAPMGTGAIRSCVPNLPTEIFYAVAFSPKGEKNNYRIQLRFVDNCL